MLKPEMKKVAEKCTNYVDIMNEKYPKNDVISEKIVKYYKAVLANTRYNDNDELNLAMLLDKCVYAYFNDNVFNEIIVCKIKNDLEQTNLGEILIKNYQLYESNPINKRSASRWI